MLLETLLLFAQEETKKSPDGLGGLLSNPIIVLPFILLAFWFFILLPKQRQERKQREELMNAMKKNDKVLTSSGILGIVSSISDKGDEVVLKLEEGKMKILKSQIIKIYTGDEKSQETLEKKS
jgi:preprotein translocase subunit YajC